MLHKALIHSLILVVQIRRSPPTISFSRTFSKVTITKEVYCTKLSYLQLNCFSRSTLNNHQTTEHHPLHSTLLVHCEHYAFFHGNVDYLKNIDGNILLPPLASDGKTFVAENIRFGSIRNTFLVKHMLNLNIFN